MAKAGAKKQVAENSATLSLVRRVSFSLVILQLVARFFFHRLSQGDVIACAVLAVAYKVIYSVMKAHARPSFDEDGKLIYGGGSLAAIGFMSYLRDILYVCWFGHLLSVFSRYGLLVILLIPAAAFAFLWKKLIKPWLFSEPPPEPTAEQQAIIDRQQDRREQRARRRMRRGAAQ
jgi:hypothetical protein